jgi:CIC family chloride channel protein
MERARGPLARATAWVRESPPGLATIAVVIGIGSGLGAIAFREMILWFTVVFTGHTDFSSAGHASHPVFPMLGPWFIVAVPVIGGLLYGPLVDRLAREARGHGVPEVMVAVAEKGGRIRPRVALVKSLASALCIGSGGSVGREGPIVQIGSALGSALGQALRLPASRLRLMVACGAAGGISATFNTPIAGVFFALELILRDFEAQSFSVVVLSSIAAAIVGRAAFGSQPFLQLPSFQITSLVEYGLYLGLGLSAGVAGVVFIRMLYGFEDLCDRIWRGPEWLRPAVGGIALGLLLLALPQMFGVGYPVLESVIGGQYGIGRLLLLLVGKLVATSLTIAIGGSGGVFAPSLFQGAMLGTAYGTIARDLLPAVTTSPGAYGLVGMGAVFAATSRAPITAALIIFELTGEYRIMLPLLFAIAIATSVSRLLSRDTIYTLKLRRRGIDLRRGRRRDLMEELHVRDAMQRLPEALAEDQPLQVAIPRFAAGDEDALPVVDGSGRFRGVLTRDLIERSMRDQDMDVHVGALATRSPTVREGATLGTALTLLVREHSGLPVLATEGETVVGWLTHRDVLAAYARRAAEVAS